MEQLSAEATPVNGSHLAQPHGRRQQRLVQEVQMLSQTWTGVTRTISGTLNLLNTWTLSKSHSRRSLVRHQVNFHKQNKQCTGSANLQLDVTLSHSVARNLHLSTNTEHGLALAAYLADHCVRRYSKQGKLEKPSRPFTRVWDLRHLRHLRLQSLPVPTEHSATPCFAAWLASSLHSAPSSRGINLRLLLRNLSTVLCSCHA